ARAQLGARLSWPALLSRARGHHVWPALAQCEVREEPRPRAISNPDHRGREVPVEELQGHQQAGQGCVQEEVSSSRPLAGRHCATAYRVLVVLSRDDLTWEVWQWRPSSRLFLQACCFQPRLPRVTLRRPTRTRPPPVLQTP